ncbi:CGNR zinc finger domain-containing protein [Allokutzneria sp. A3M-2-11 16]|uniref:CGNR zinc finger domain-containing protein n=1 Tax=Allokutzneria sp. A3M-2-11 16 TaxID=2962043 RepID=UPI0020B75F88|nr:CGNR zinc finger domain-containing protein [Allokutzneria sp. A3M-2-11 16]MCP3802341.1 CGNR zinc finger domain-containing protein [Allokutzneria sp. A3M-2-11 16]
MRFTDDTASSLVAAVALVNSAEEPDTLTSLDQLDAFFAEHGYSGSRSRDADELAAVRALRAPLRALLVSDRDTAAEIVNRMLAEHHALPQLVRHDGLDYHLHAVDAERPFAERIAVETAMAMVDLIRADEMSRLSLCDSDVCEGLVLDLSRNRSRRYCSTTCGNRLAVAAYRARRS